MLLRSEGQSDWRFSVISQRQSYFKSQKNLLASQKSHKGVVSTINDSISYKSQRYKEPKISMDRQMVSSSAIA